MAASNSSNSASHSPTSPGTRKKARTKHACDECRRSQKKCDGELLCHRCRSNGTKCVYTPHKSRSHCSCIGQSGETRLDTSTADIHFFSGSPPDATMGAFPIWPMSSPESHPGGPGASSTTPSPTSLDPSDLNDFHPHNLGYHLSQVDATPSAVQLHAQARRSHSVPNLFESSESLTHASRSNAFFDPSSLPDVSRAWDGTNPGSFQPQTSDTFLQAHGDYATYSAALNTQSMGPPPRSDIDTTMYDITGAAARNNVAACFPPPIAHDQRRPSNIHPWESTSQGPFRLTTSSPPHSPNYGNLAYVGNQHLTTPSFVPASAVSSSTFLESVGTQAMQHPATPSRGQSTSQSDYRAPSQNFYSQEYFSLAQAPGSAPVHPADTQWISGFAEHSSHSPQSARSCPSSAFPSPPAFGNSNFDNWA